MYLKLWTDTHNALTQMETMVIEKWGCKSKLKVELYVPLKISKVVDSDSFLYPCVCKKVSSKTKMWSLISAIICPFS